MYRGKNKKAVLTNKNFKVLQIEDTLILQVTPLVNTSVIFLEDIEGTKIVLIRDQTVINEIIHPFIKPSMIVDSGGLIPDALKDKYKSIIEKEFDIKFYDQKEYDKLNAVERIYYVEKTIDISHLLIYKLKF